MHFLSLFSVDQKASRPFMSNILPLVTILILFWQNSTPGLPLSSRPQSTGCSAAPLPPMLRERVSPELLRLTLCLSGPQAGQTPLSDPPPLFFGTSSLLLSYQGATLPLISLLSACVSSGLPSAGWKPVVVTRPWQEAVCFMAFFFSSTTEVSRVAERHFWAPLGFCFVQVLLIWAWETLKAMECFLFFICLFLYPRGALSICTFSKWAAWATPKLGSLGWGEASRAELWAKVYSREAPEPTPWVLTWLPKDPSGWGWPWDWPEPNEA